MNSENKHSQPTAKVSPTARDSRIAEVANFDTFADLYDAVDEMLEAELLREENETGENG